MPPFNAVRVSCVITTLGLILLLGGCAARQTGSDTSPYAPEDVLSTFQLQEGFKIELFAAEPLVKDPVAMTADEAGRLYVVEMPGYPLDTGGTGKVKLLTDTDGDGRPDQSKVFAEGLTLPTGIMRWKNGVIVTDAPEVLYLEDTNGDGRADKRRRMLTGFGLSNPQHNVNSPIYGLDNWIYLANEGIVGTKKFEETFGDRGGEVFFPEHKNGPRLPRNAGGRSVRFRPESYELEMLSSKTQFGHTFDAWGHYLLNSNSNHIYHEVVSAKDLKRNPNLVVANATEQLPDHGAAAKVYPITENPSFQMLTNVGVFTSASGITYYQGGAFPASYSSQISFVAEPVHNLVHADHLKEKGATFTARRLQEKTEFLASRDNWFRPVNFYIGPDGALYLIDYYRKYIEHPEWMSDEVVESDDLYAGTEYGRIYRITADDAEPAAWLNNLKLGEASGRQLVQMLERPNIWWRRTAQRLLVDRQPGREVVEALKALVRESSSAKARVHALWTLEGVGELHFPVIEEALSDPAAGVRENAVQLARLHLKSHPDLISALMRLENDTSPKVRYQLLLALGDVTTEDTRRLRRRLLFEHIEDKWMQVAALSAADSDAQAFFQAASVRLTNRRSQARTTFFERIGSVIGRQEGAGYEMVIRRAAETISSARSDWWRAASLRGLARGLDGRTLQGPVAASAAERLLETFFANATHGARSSYLEVLEETGLPGGQLQRRILAEALQTAQNAQEDALLRSDAVKLLALDAGPEQKDRFKALITPEEPTALQVAAVQALGPLKEQAIGAFILKRWRLLTPEVRSAAIDGWLAHPAGAKQLVEAIGQGQIKRAEISQQQRSRLIGVDDKKLRRQARKLLVQEAGARQAVIDRYKEALALKGHAKQGKKVFQQVCARCHQMGQTMGMPFGPDLSTVQNRPPQGILPDIIAPGRSIADGYELWTIKRKNGDAIQGVISHETSSSLTLRTAAGQEQTVARHEVVSMEASEFSAMPQGLEQQITMQQMADLLAFIRKGG